MSAEKIKQSLDKDKEYSQLLREFTAYRQQSIAEKQQLKKEIQKCRQLLDKFMTKIDKRVDSRINQQRNLNNHHLEQLEQQHKLQTEQLRQAISQRDLLIQDLRKMLRQVQIQKREIIQNHTKVLIELSQSIDPRTKKGSKDNSNKQILKMYQFLIEQNNELKKQIYVLKRNNLASSHYKQSPNTSYNIPKIPLNQSKKDLDKSLSIKEPPKDKAKKVVKNKQGK